MRSIALGLDLGESYFDDKVSDQCHNLRLLSYPPVTRSVLEKEGQARAGAHSGMHPPHTAYSLFSLGNLDYGTVTLLFQDSVSRPIHGKNHPYMYLLQVGGLEVQNPHNQVFHAAPPIVRALHDVL